VDSLRDVLTTPRNRGDVRFPLEANLNCRAWEKVIDWRQVQRLSPWASDQFTVGREIAVRHAPFVPRSHPHSHNIWELNMSENQSGKIEKKKANPKNIALIGAGATVLVIVNMSTGVEVPSQGVIILQYTALAGALLTLVGGLIMIAMGPK
jgi:hypothetical protein